MKYITSYSSKYKNKQFDKICDLDALNPYNIEYNNIYGLRAYNTYNDNIHFIKIIRNKLPYKLQYINKYNEFYINEITYLPFNTKYFATQKIYGTSIFITNCGGKITKFKKFKDIKNNVDYNFNTLEFKYLISKYPNYIFEFKITLSNIYLVNIFHDDKILTYDEIKNISNDINIDIPKKVDFDCIRDGGIVTFNYSYNDYFLDEYDFMPEKTYMLNFIFKNNKYLFVRINI